MTAILGRYQQRDQQLHMFYVVSTIPYLDLDYTRCRNIRLILLIKIPVEYLSQWPTQTGSSKRKTYRIASNTARVSN